MSDHLSDVFRTNVRRILDERGITPYRLSRDMGADHMLVTTQIIYRAGKLGVTLATVERYAAALDVDPLALLTPPEDAERAA